MILAYLAGVICGVLIGFHIAVGYSTPQSDPSTSSTPHENPKSAILTSCPIDSDSGTGK
jgi:hypothetical protein